MNFETCPLRPLRLVLALLVGALVSLLSPRPADACKCGIDGPIISAPDVPVELAGSITIAVDEATLTCDRVVGRFPIACKWEGRYRFEHAGEAAAIPLTVAFPRGAAIRIALDGVVAASERTVDPRSLRERRDDLPPQQTITAVWDAPQDGAVAVVVTAELRVDPWDACCGRDTNNRRHPVLNPWRFSLYRLGYGRVSKLHNATAWTLAIDTPRAWRGHTDGGKPHGRRRSEVVKRGMWIDPREPFVPVLIDRPLRLDRGGPIAAVGLGFEPGGVAPRLRFGWELAWPNALVHTIAVETDARRRVVLVPAWEATLSYLGTWFLDFALGLGVPIQVAPAPRPGVRVLGRMGWRMVHLLGIYDAYPAFRGAPLEHHGALMLQVGM